MQVGDSLKLLSFGKDYGDDAKFNNWIYNIPSSHSVSNINQVNVNTFRITIFDLCVFYIDEVLILKNDDNEQTEITVKQIEYDSTNVEQIYSNTIVVQAGHYSFKCKCHNKDCYQASHNTNYFTEVSNFPVGIQNSYIDKDQKFFYVTSSGLPNYPIFATDNKVFVKTSSVEVVDGSGTLLGGGFTYTIQSFDSANVTLTSPPPLPHNYVTGDKIYWDNTTNSGINTGVYFVTAINQTEFYLSFSGADVFAQKYIV